MQLKRWYNKYNKTHWGGKLPKNVVVEWSSNIPKGSIAGAHVHGISYCDKKHCPPNCKISFIRVDPVLKKMGMQAIVLGTLLHEMIHVSALLGHPLRVNHGREFHKEWKRLAAKGAFRDIC